MFQRGKNNMKLFDYLKWKRKYNKIKKLYEEEKENNLLLINENQILKTALIGQVFPLNILTDHLFEQSHGYRKWGDTHAYVMTGLSLWGPPFRIGTHSELLVVDIVSTSSTAE